MNTAEELIIRTAWNKLRTYGEYPTIGHPVMRCTLCMFNKVTCFKGNNLMVGCLGGWSMEEEGPAGDTTIM